MGQEAGDPLMGHLARKQTLPYRITYPRGSTFGPLCLSFPEDCGGSGGRRPTDGPLGSKTDFTL